MGAFIDRTGRRYGKLVALERMGTCKRGRSVKWRCRCDCGKEKTIRGASLSDGRTRSCGCARSKDRTGKRYGMLTVLERVGVDRAGNVLWRCLCDCGEEIIARATRLKNGTTKNCGQHRLSIDERATNQLYAGYRCDARDRGLVFDLSKEKFRNLTKGNCYYCGQSPAQTLKDYATDGFIYNGIDRVDNEKGYIEENVVPCCKTCNYAKRNMPADEFTAWIARVAKHLGLT